MLFPIISLPLFIAVVVIMFYQNNRSRKKQYDFLTETLGAKIILSLEQVRTETTAMGKRDRNFMFRHCDVHVTDDALILFGCSKNSLIKQLSVPIIITQNTQKYFTVFPFAYCIIPKKVNLHSFNQDVFIEIGEASFTSTAADIILKEISESDKEKLHFLEQHIYKQKGETG